MKDNAATIDWSQSALSWNKHRETVKRMFTPVTEALVQDARISGGRILDVATGPGEPALSIAGLLGSAGQVVGIDPIPEMIAGAQRVASETRLQNAHFEVASADRLPLESASFDAAVSRFGVMFFPDPLEGIREVLRVLKPGSRLAMAVWHFARCNPSHFLVTQIVDRYVPAAPVPPDSPEPFRFAEPGKLKTVFGQAGAIETNERLLRFRLKASMSLEDYWSMRLEMAEKLRQRIFTLPEEQRRHVKQEVFDAIGTYFNADGMSFPAEVLIVSGMKSD